MAMTLDELTKSLRQGSYTPQTEEALQHQAQAKYQSEWAQNKLLLPRLNTRQIMQRKMYTWHDRKT